MVYAVVERCPVFGGSVGSFDATKAKAVPGVRQVLQIESGVAVVADSTWAALQGREALSVVWNEGPHAALNSAEDSPPTRGRREETGSRGRTRRECGAKELSTRLEKDRRNV